MYSERAQIVLRVSPLYEEDKSVIIETLLQLESVRTAVVDVQSGLLKVDGAASDVELFQVIEGLGKRAVLVTHTRGVAASRPAPAASSTGLRMQLFMKLLRRQVDCCGQ